MDTIHFTDTSLPVYVHTENIEKRNVHSGMAHWHDHIELIVVNNGTILCQTAADKFELHAGDVCFINRKQLHQIHTKDGDVCNHKVLIIGTSLLSQNPLIYEKYIRPMLEDVQFSHIRFEGESSPAAIISRLTKKIAKLSEEKNCGYEIEMVSDIYQLFHQICIAYREEPKDKPLDNNAIIQQKMSEYIYENFSESISLDDIAASGAVSRSQSIKLFKKYTGLSPVSFLNRHRLEVSLDLLRSSSESVAGIAQKCGFSDQSYFNRLFLREYGVTPLAYRKS